MRTSRPLVAAILAALVLSLLPAAMASADPPAGTAERVDAPDSIAVLGDSISTATGAFGPLGAERPQHSWATGTTASVNSNYQRLLALNPGAAGNNVNMASNGRRMVHMADQAAGLPTSTEYVMVQLGGNDLCQPTVAQMTSVEAYRAQFVEGLETLSERVPDALIYVASIPDIYNLWYIRGAPNPPNPHQSNQAGQARLYWGAGIIPCQALLANPTSMAEADVERREQVRLHNQALNQVLEEECAALLRCRFDDHALFNFSSNRVNPPDGPLLPHSEWSFTDLDISRNAAGFAGALCPLTGITGNNCGDHFHPSLQGQAKLAEIGWDTSYDFTDTTAPTAATSIDPAPNAAGWNNTALTVRAEYDDDAGVRGIEHRVHTDGGTVGDWEVTFGDVAEIEVADEGVHHVEVRALDRNGNLSASEVVTVRVDLTDPTVDLTTPADGQVVTLGESVAAAYECSDDLSGVETCEGTTASGDAIDTATVGSKSFSVTAVDVAGNTTEVTHGYQVHYVWSGVAGRLAGPDPTVKGGAALPVRFTLADADGALRSDATVAVYLEDADGAERPASQPGEGHPGNLARWDAGEDQYVFTIDTTGLAAGAWELILRPDDGAEHRVSFTIR